MSIIDVVTESSLPSHDVGDMVTLVTRPASAAGVTRGVLPG